MVRGSKLDVVAFFEGVNIPIISISVSSTVSMPSLATIDIPYTSETKDIMETTHVVVFYSDASIEMMQSPAIDRYKLLFHGEVTAVRIQRNAQKMSWQIYAIDSRTYLNRMPSQFMWYLVNQDVHEYADDYNFYGLPVDDKNNPSTSWYENITQLQETYPQGQSPGGYGTDKFCGSPLRLSSGMGIRLLNGKPDDHLGEDFIVNSPHDAYCRFFSPWSAKIEAAGWDSTGYGNYVQLRLSPTEYIQFGHLDVINPSLKVGGTIQQGQWFGNMGNSGRSTGMHVHIRWYRKNSNASAEIGERYKDFVRLTRPSNTPQGWSYTTEGMDMMHRIIGYGKYRTLSDNSGLRDVISYPLEQYIKGILDLLATCEGQHLYYRNANTRYMIQRNHDTQDFGNQFKILWGADYYISFMGSEYRNLSKYRYTTADNMYAMLKNIGYVGSSTTSPKYDHKSGRLHEYLLTVDLIRHRPPMFNYIYIEEEDGVSYSGKSTPVTALRHRAGFGGIKSVVSDMVSPANAYGIGGMYLLREEHIYGINRMTKDINYFLRAYIGDFQLEFDSPHLYQRLVDYERITTGTGRDIVDVTKSSFHPEYVVGLPALVYCKELGVGYDGVIRSIDIHINTNSGICQTRVIIQNAVQSNDTYSGTVSRNGVTPESRVDKEIMLKIDDMYRSLYYKDDVSGEVSVSGGHVYMENTPNMLNDRDICSMRQYLTMYKHKNIDALSQHKDIGGISDLSLTSDGVPPVNTFKTNATKRLTINKMSDMYIKERYDIAKALESKIKGSRVIVINE